VFRAAAKSGASIRCDPAMRGYRDLFEREFAGEKRLRDIISDGLPLGPLAVDIETAGEILGRRAGTEPGTGGATQTAADRTARAAPRCAVPPAGTAPAPAGSKAGTLRDFIVRERDSLIKLRKILTGEITPLPEELEGLLDEADYLWAHFPDCAGTGGRRPPATDISFLKRVRAELDPFIGLWEFLLRGGNPADTR
jgi:hypothetical protein